MAPNKQKPGQKKSAASNKPHTHDDMQPIPSEENKNTPQSFITTSSDTPQCFSKTFGSKFVQVFGQETSFSSSRQQKLLSYRNNQTEETHTVRARSTFGLRFSWQKSHWVSEMFLHSALIIKFISLLFILVVAEKTWKLLHLTLKLSAWIQTRQMTILFVRTDL